jgi:hypothetical protein
MTRASISSCTSRASIQSRMDQRWACAGQGEGHEAGAGSVKLAVEARIRALRAEGMGILQIGRTIGVGTSVVQTGTDRAPVLSEIARPRRRLARRTRHKERQRKADTAGH